MLPAFLSETELPPRPLLAALHVTANVAAGGGRAENAGADSNTHTADRGAEQKGEIQSYTLGMQ